MPFWLRTLFLNWSSAIKNRGGGWEGGGDKNVRVLKTSENRYTVISVDDLMVALLRMSPVVLMKVFKVKEIKFDS